MKIGDVVRYHLTPDVIEEAIVTCVRADGVSVSVDSEDGTKRQVLIAGLIGQSDDVTQQPVAPSTPSVAVEPPSSDSSESVDETPESASEGDETETTA